MADSNYYNELAQRATTDEEAFEELYEYFFPRVYNFIYARLKNASDADDVTSTTFLKMNENLEYYDPAKAAFSTWLFRIANNALIDQTRRHEKNQETEWEEFFDPSAPPDGEPPRPLSGFDSENDIVSRLSVTASPAAPVVSHQSPDGREVRSEELGMRNEELRLKSFRIS